MLVIASRHKELDQILDKEIVQEIHSAVITHPVSKSASKRYF